MTKIQLSDHFTYKRLIRFVTSTILMLICTSLYSIVDGVFVSNFVGKTPFAAINLIMPVIMAVGAIGFMAGTGGSAIVSKTLGEGKPRLANQMFSMVIYALAAVGIVFSVAGIVFMRPICVALGATGELLEACVLYGRISFAGQTAFLLQNAFQSFFIAAEKPGLSLKISVAAGLTNVVLDYLFIVVLHWGLAGAAVATVMGQVVGGILPAIYFAGKNHSLLRLCKTRMDFNVLKKVCFNGSSEMVTTVSVSVVSVLFNFQLMNLAGENGIAAYGIIMYVNFIFMAVYLGYSMGSAPIVSFHYGAGNHGELHNLFKKSLVLMLLSGVVMTLAAELLSAPLVQIFAGYDEELYQMTCRGFRLYSLSFLIMSINVWGSGFFTALNNGMVSAAISFLRTFLFQIMMVMVLPVIFGIDGIWLSVVAAEAAAGMVTVWFLISRRKQYHYA